MYFGMRHGLSQLGMIATSGYTKHLFSIITRVSMMLTWESGAQKESLSAGYVLVLGTKHQLATQLFATQPSWCIQFVCWNNPILKALEEKFKKENGYAVENNRDRRSRRV